jgi:DNA modification methylase
MRYLVKLVTMPTGTRILDPFAGSGSTLVACCQLGIECVVVDLDPTNCRIADGRLSYRVGVSKHRKLKLRGRKHTGSTTQKEL